MIHIELKEPSGPKLDKWKQKAREETRKLVENTQKGKTLEFKSNIWGDLKDFLKERFHGKCAYCEGNYSAGSYLDVEHYRPKKKVTVKEVTVDGTSENTVKIKDTEGNEKDHPGYYWLAYDWRNLLLSCEKCNRGSGKMNQFPIKGKRACCPEDPLAEEDPLLLNPYVEENPEEHFKVSKIDGLIEGTTEKGKRTIDICDLNREELHTSRLKEWEKSKVAFFFDLIKGGIEKVVSDDREFSAYLRKALKEYVRHNLRQEIDKRV